MKTTISSPGRASQASRPSRGKQSQAMMQLVQGMRADIVDYRRLREFLELQFHGALRHQSHTLVDVAANITELVDTLEQRRQERVALASELIGPGEPVSMQGVMRLLTESSRAVVQADWDMLEGLVRECKEANARNCRLLTEQHEIMQRVLNREADTYAPA